tara:strand:- start:40 stop:597 length:558 start_codon:yes stop_codon:yes gene_type:complete
MKLLLENWRKYLNEAAMDINSLPERTVVVINEGWGVDIYYSEIGNMGNTDTDPRGRIRIERTSYESEEDCDGAWSVRSVSADSGWGPMLYDIAIEWATQNANGLIADRAAVEDDAKNVWDYYLNKRDDVQVHQLGNDNCDQDVAIEDRGEDDWANSPLSKRYTKEPTTINALNDAGKLKVRRDLK